MIASDEQIIYFLKSALLKPIHRFSGIPIKILTDIFRKLDKLIIIWVDRQKGQE